MNGTYKYFDKITVRIAGIVEDSITDGPGLRTTIFTQGCPHRCEGCHNSHTWSMTGGTDYTLAQIYDLIAQNPILDGVTFSGGEPLEQIDKLAPLIKRIKTELKLDIALYTGYGYEDLLLSTNNNVTESLKYMDTLIDGKFLLSMRNLNNKFKGSDNQRIIDIQKSLASNSVVLNDGTRWN